MGKAIIIIAALTILLFSGSILANIINVPIDQATIQQGINVASNGDTILVQPETYVENINFNGKNIVVGSLFLTTQDTTYISQTVIDGNHNGSVIIFENGEDTTTVLCGFTLTNGTGTYWTDTGYSGGAIYCRDSNPCLINLVINANTSDYGGGICIREHSSPNLENVTLSRNSAIENGGGIYIHNSNPSLLNIFVIRNTADVGGGICLYGSNATFENIIISNNVASGDQGACGGLLCSYNCNLSLVNVTVTENTASSVYNGIGCAENTNLNVINSILWNNSSQEIYFPDWGSPNSVTITYSNLKGGEAGILTNNNGNVNWLDGNMDTDPLFVDSTSGDFHIQDSSYCIGAGVDSMQINDTWYYAPPTDIEGNPRPNPASSNPDMGAYENTRAEPLPVELSSFAVSIIENKVKLQWITTTETNNYGFKIERSEGLSWITIGFVEGNGTTTQPQNYEFVDDLLNVKADIHFVHYRLKQIDTDGSFEYSQVVTVNLKLPLKFELLQNYPNPFNPLTQIKYTLPKAGHITLRIYNIAGQEIETLINTFQTAGEHQVKWMVKGLSSGIYFYRLQAGDYSETKKLILQR